MQKTARNGLKVLFALICLAVAVEAQCQPAGSESLQIGKATLHLQWDSDLPLARAHLVGWIYRAAVAVTNYLGFFPVNSVVIVIHASRGDAVGGGVTHGASRIDVDIGPDARPNDLRSDWIMTHEMFHLAFPTLPRRFLWMMEGLSDYLEPVARARAGQLTPREVWREFVENFPQGLPAADGKGLNDSHTRERIYWGGNIFWLLADVQVRRQTRNRHSIDDAIRAILKAGGNGGADWSIERVIRVGDKATRTTVLRDLYNELGLQRGDIHLDSLWQSLGVLYNDRAVRFDDSAPWAPFRAAITAPNRR